MTKRGGAKVDRMCQNCGKLFMAYLIEIRRREVRFCSWECYQDWRRKNRLTKQEICRKAREYNHRIKLEVLSYYSNGAPKCARCGINDVDVLCIDHIEGGGTQLRIDTRHWGTKLHHFLKRNNYPKGYQILCANCNLKKFVVDKK